MTAVEKVTVTDRLESFDSEFETVDVGEVDIECVPKVVSDGEREILGDTVLVAETELTRVVVGMCVTAAEPEPLTVDRKLSDISGVVLPKPDAVLSATVALDMPERVSPALNEDDDVAL